ncbi:fungal-specific transcription factor domain-containing protein [Pyronema domesticum]|uniref:Similar to Transcriptional regulatory protein moc3 acc. no. Q9UT46 n=1 Tax=Pyronema omphalodes (strain CBS 100304) TaxID=1076935 RepID=U4KVL2_PYROM|nr:fungal-specific transcription factor domain-containing protein [Pyronema domesticum]CCX05347.1 Similar to Transcriptional regulatory protein moc3; acc. no. Q9UT46 [Pyronema omphalodes CBS 100304]CCX06627.1 Similar to Transcriptional regulatory protein moc3; acc. no. Q9UT46 [Pyronema omphalodes CBS 100304]
MSGSYSPSSPDSNASSPQFDDPVLQTMADCPVTKIEELDDDNDQLMNAPPLPTTDAPHMPEVPVKRGRGRPRKHPIVPAKPVQKITKGRSKTGCVTCRRRKKKCDETKPECNNCVKNSVVCEGYPEKTVWQPGRQRGEGREDTFFSSSGESLSFAVRRAASVISRSLPTLIDGLQTPMDQHLLDHFTHRVSRILTLFDEESNPFHDYLLPLAMHNSALMHALLALSSSHLAGADGKREDYTHARDRHFGEAVSSLRICLDKDGADSLNAATALVLCLDSIARGDTGGQYRDHLNGARHMLCIESQDDISLRRFLFEFFAYHDVASSLTRMGAESPGSCLDDYAVPAYIAEPQAGAMLGVLDGLFRHMSQVTILRNQIRHRRINGEIPHVDYKILMQSLPIDQEIRDWKPNQPPNTVRYIAAQFYRQAAWVYLYRTVMPSARTEKIITAVDDGLQLLRLLPEQSGTQSILLMPLFIIGCAAFAQSQREEISQRFRGLYDWSGLGNILHAHTVVERVWELMDEGNEEASWDWERLMSDMKVDILVT